LIGVWPLFLGLGRGRGFGFLSGDDDEDLVGDEVERGRMRLKPSESDANPSLGEELRTGEELRELDRDLGLGRGLGGGDLNNSELGAL